MGPRSKNQGIMSLDGMVFGMPPSTHVSDGVMINSMPTATITPCEPRFSEGLSLFSLDQSEGKIQYDKILKSVGFSLSGNTINVAYLADNFPTDSFNNEYGETFLDRFAQAASGGLGDISQILGFTDFEKVQSSLSNMGKGVSNSVPGAGAVIDGITGALNSADSMGKSIAGNFQGGSKMYQNMKNTIKSIVTGARVDFPQVWKNSSFTPSYSMTIRLYNPNPGDPESTKRYIVGPIAALVSLGVPKVAEDSSTYKWPLLCKVRSKGIYHLNAAYINSISVIKGGDQQSIGYNQALAMCDVRIDFGSLYNSILAGPGTDKLGLDRPTLGTYLEAIGGKSVTGSDKSKQLYFHDPSPLKKVPESNKEIEEKQLAKSKVEEIRDADRVEQLTKLKQQELLINNTLAHEAFLTRNV